MTKEQREIIRHSLGLNRSPQGYRNYFCAENGDAELELMVESGWMKHGLAINEGRDRYYHVTQAGAEAVGSKLD